MVNTGSLVAITVAKVVAEVFGAMVYAPLAVILAMSFGVDVRYTGVSIGYQFAAILGGGFAPFIAAALFAASGAWSSVGIYYAAVVLVSFIAMLFLRPRGDEPAEADAPAPATASR
jgi:hypothetical protein